MKRHKESYGPDLSATQKAKLLREIAQFDTAKTKRIIEENAVGKGDIDAYQDWVDNNGGLENKRANPDLLSEDESIDFGRPISDKTMELAKKEINAILSHREAQVWQKVMRDGLTLVETADKLRISQPTVSGYLKSAEKKVQKHFEGLQ